MNIIQDRRLAPARVFVSLLVSLAMVTPSGTPTARASQPRASRDTKLDRLEQRVSDLTEAIDELEAVAMETVTTESGRRHDRASTSFLVRSTTHESRLRALFRRVSKLRPRVAALEEAGASLESLESSISGHRHGRGRQANDRTQRRLTALSRRVQRLAVRVRALQGPTGQPEEPVGPAAVTCPAGARAVLPAENLQAALNTAGAYASVCIKQGIYRPSTPVRPLQGQVLTFEEGAVLSGARIVTRWIKQGSYWVLEGQSQDFSSDPWLKTHDCRDNPTACIYEDLYRDDVPLQHVRSLSALGPGKVYFDKARDRMYVAQDPAGHKMEATMLTVGISSAATGVTIRGGIIEKMGWFGIKVTGSGWTIEDTEIRYAHATGLRLKGDNHVVRRNAFHHNGNTGIVATDVHGITVEGNDVGFNNYLHFGHKPTPFHEGGAKFLNTSDVTLRGNYSHANDGDGWWFDTDNIDILVENNVFESNTRSGLFYEVSYDAVIRQNVFRNNATDPTWMGSGLSISSSRNVEVVDNSFEDNGYSTLFANSTDRGSGRYGKHETTNLHVHDNVFMLHSGWIGSSWGLAAFTSAAANNRFAGNTYIVPDTGRKWWIWGSGGFLDWTKWRSLGFDGEGNISAA